MKADRPDQHARWEISTEPRIRHVWAFWILLAIALLFLAFEHRAHFLGALPYLLLLACPLMHYFMHRRHGGHGKRDSAREL